MCGERKSTFANGGHKVKWKTTPFKRADSLLHGSPEHNSFVCTTPSPQNSSELSEIIGIQMSLYAKPKPLSSFR